MRGFKSTTPLFNISIADGKHDAVYRVIPIVSFLLTGKGLTLDIKFFVCYCDIWEYRRLNMVQSDLEDYL